MQTIETNSFETIYLGPLHLILRSFETTTLETCSFKTTFTWDFFIWDRVHVRPHSFDITFILRQVKLKLVWFAVYHMFMIYLPLLCRRLEVLQGDYSFDVLQGYALPCPKWLTLGFKCTCTLKHRRGEKTLHASGLEGSVAPLKCHFVRPSQRIICSAFLPVSFIEAPKYSVFSFQLKNERREKKKRLFSLTRKNHSRKSNFVAIEKRNATAYEQNVWRAMRPACWDPVLETKCWE